MHKPNCLTLPTVNMNTQPSLRHYAPLIRLRHLVLYTGRCVVTDRLMHTDTEKTYTVTSAMQLFTIKMPVVSPVL